MPAGDGPKTVYAQVRDAAENVSLPASRAIDLDSSVASEFDAVSIDAGADFTGSRDVILDLYVPAGVARIKVANDNGGLATAPWEPYVAHMAWTLSDPHGVIVTKNVYVRFSDGPSDSGTTASDDIVIDPTAPTADAVAALTLSLASQPASPASAKTATLNTSASDQQGGSGVVAMEISTSKHFAGAVWQPYAPSAKWRYDTRAKTIVYFRFMDGAGNVSIRYSKSLAKPSKPTIPTQLAPLNRVATKSRRPTFSWLGLLGSPTYQLQVSASSSFTTTLQKATTKKQSYTPTTSLPAGKLYWRVRKAGGKWSPAWRFAVPASNPPTLTAPANGTTLGTLSPNLSWAAVSGATSYQVQLGPDDIFLTGVQSFNNVSATHLELVPLARQASYSWRVRAKVSGVFGPWSAGRSFATPAIDTVSLMSPANGSHLSGLPALLDWTDVTGAASYHLQVCSNGSCTTTVRDANFSNSLMQLSSPLPAGTYWWRVQAMGSGSVTGAWSSMRSFVR